MSEDITISFPEGTEGMVESWRQPRLRPQIKEHQNVRDISWSFSHLGPKPSGFAARTGDYSVPAGHERNMNLNMEKVEIGDKKELCF